MPKKWKWTGTFTLEGVTFEIERTDGGPHPTRTITIVDADYLGIGDASPAWIPEHIKGLVTAFGELSTFDYSFDNQTGIVSFFMGSAETATITWVGAPTPPNGSIVRDWLRFSGTTTDITDVATPGSQCHEFGFYPNRVAVDDTEIETPQGVQGVADDKSVQTITTQAHQKRRVRFRYDGFPRKLGAPPGEYEQFIDFAIRSASGAPVRGYPDRVTPVTTPYVRSTNPDGYHLLVLLEESWGFDPVPALGNNYARFDTGPLMWQVVPS